MKSEWHSLSKLLIQAKSNRSIVALRTEFEAEGARSLEVAHLVRLAAMHGFPVDLKIGGAEAVRDLHEAKDLGVSWIIAPMIETPYALKKFIDAAKRVYSELLDEVKLFINIETVTGCENFSNMLKTPEIKHIEGIVMGRIDLAGSMGLSRNEINREILKKTIHPVIKKAKDYPLKVVVGGAVDLSAWEFFNSFAENEIDYLDTRKMVLKFSLNKKQFEEAIFYATQFELLWLTSKYNDYRAMSLEDENRKQLLMKRLNPEKMSLS